MSDCRFGVSPVTYPDPDPDHCHPAGDVTRVLVVPGKVTVKIGDAKN